MARHLLGGPREKLGKKVSGFISRIFFKEKMDNWLGYLCMAGLACITGFLLSTDLVAGVSLFLFLVGVLALTIFVTDPETCFYFFLFFAFWIYFFNSCFFHGNFPVGTLYDIIAVITLFGLMVGRPDFRANAKAFGKITLAAYFFVIFFFNILEIFNPNTGGISTTVITGIRKFFDFIIILFAAYTLIDSLPKVRKFNKMLFIAAGVSALYGCIQQWHGLFPWDMEAIMANPDSFGLLFVNGQLRKFGTMNDPSEFGLLMAATALYFFIIALYEKDKATRLSYFVGIILMILALGYSGTRTAYATLIAGLGFFILLNIEKPAIQRLGIASVAVFLLLMFGPFQGIAPIRRFRTTFIGTQDQSYKVRMIARAWVQPYIRSHPIGGGLGTTGLIGAREHPGHPLANFQPDGAYVQKAAETGYIGLALICILYFMIMQLGIKGFFRARSPQIKNYYAACLSAIFSLYVGEYAQQAVGGVSDSLFYFPAIAIMLNLKYMDIDAPEKFRII